MGIAVTTIVLAWLGHAEFLSYVDRSGNVSHLGETYAIKWTISIGAFLYYLIFGEVKARRKKCKNASKDRDLQVEKQTKNDGFDEIRSKHKLENRADKVVNK